MSVNENVREKKPMKGFCCLICINVEVISSIVTNVEDADLEGIKIRMHTYTYIRKSPKIGGRVYP